MLFLLAFVGYMVVAIVALCLDWEAMVCDCAADSWIWLYVLLALAIPTTFGFIMGLVKAGLALADLKKKVGWEIPDVFLALPGNWLVVGWVGGWVGGGGICMCVCIVCVCVCVCL